jgi:sphinganine-1-phosphate aldolase
VPLPARGLDRDTLLERLEACRAQDLATHGGRTWAYVYDSGRRDADAVGVEAHGGFAHANALDPTVFPSMLQLENDIVDIAAAHLGGGAEVAGNFTSGGTESCMLAVKTARDHARATRPDVTRPRMVLPESAHAAFQKAGHYFGVDVVRVPVDADTFKADVDAVAAAVDENTILVVASAVSYPHGVVDPIPELGALAAERGCLLHVDACAGGWLLPYLRRLGADIIPFDFTVPGVTSMSVDLHKYAYTPKGASVVLYRDRALRRHQLFACATWNGYTVINATMQGTKSGGPLAAAWATLHYLGDDGYLEIARRTQAATGRLIEGVERIPGLRVLGRPEMSLLAFTSTELDLFEVVDEMKARAWYIQPQLTYGASPPNIHLSVTGASLERVDELLTDLAACCDLARALEPDPEEEALLAGLADLDASAFTPEVYADMLALAGLGSGDALPERMAPINRILNVLPAALREQLVIEFLNGLYR